MSKINDYHANKWIENNHPENGLFRVYWKDIIDNHKGGATLDSDEGEGLRYEWYYKDGLKDGTSRGWYPNGQLKQKGNYKNGELHGHCEFFDEEGNLTKTETWENGKLIE